MSMLVMIDETKLAAAHGKVVKAAHFSRLVETEQVIAAARQRAQQIVAAAETQAQQTRQDGYDAGTIAAREEFAASVVETTARIESAFVGLEARIVNTVMNAVQQILGELDDRRVMESVIRRVLAGARADKNLRLRVASRQFDEVNQMLVGILAEFPEVEFVDVVKDPEAANGTCVLESEFGVVDGSIYTQLAAVRAGLINAFVGKRMSAETRASRGPV